MIKHENNVITIANVSKEITINGIKQEKTLFTKEVDGITYIPLDFAGKSLGFSVQWNENTKTILATKNDVTDKQLKNFENIEDMIHPPKEEVVEIAAPPPSTPLYYQEGIASWYGAKLHGHKTANGERFNKNALTAAHISLPFGTIAKVTYLRNGKSVLVRINDRGPQSKTRILDLSRAAADALGMTRAGIGQVKLEVLAENNTSV